MTGRPLTPDEIAALAALPVTPGSWWPSRHNGPNDVDRGKIWAFRAGPPPVQMIVVAEVNRFIGTEADQRLAAASPDLLATTQHLLQRAERAEGRASEWEQTGREAVDSVLACDVELDDAGVAAGPLPERMRSLLRQRDEARANYAFMVERAADQRLDGYRELGAKCAALESERDALRAEVARLQSDRDAQREALRSEVAALRHALAGRGCT